MWRPTALRRPGSTRSWRSPTLFLTAIWMAALHLIVAVGRVRIAVLQVLDRLLAWEREGPFHDMPLPATGGRYDDIKAQPNGARRG